MAKKPDIPCAFSTGAELRLTHATNQMMNKISPSIDITLHAMSILAGLQNPYAWRTTSAQLFLIAFSLLKYHSELWDEKREQSSASRYALHSDEEEDVEDVGVSYSEEAISQIAFDENLKIAEPDALILLEGLIKPFYGYDKNVVNRALTAMATRWRNALRTLKSDEWGDVSDQAQYLDSDSVENMSADNFAHNIMAIAYHFVEHSTGKHLPQGTQEAFHKAILELAMTELALSLAYELQMGLQKQDLTIKRSRRGKQKRAVPAAVKKKTKRTVSLKMITGGRTS